MSIIKRYLIKNQALDTFKNIGKNVLEDCCVTVYK